MATLATQERHSMGDLTLHVLKFSAVAVTDNYSLTNSPGIIGAWGSPFAATGSGGFSLNFTNSATGGTLDFTVGTAGSVNAYVIAQG